jgi:geranylgeranyl diphosphate/geranylgeranyl-bacteriochlorophyllide a reductase
METFDVVVVGGGPAGATCAHDLSATGQSVLLIDRAGRTKPCGGAIPPQLIREFAIPTEMLVARIHVARIVSPRGREVDIPVGEEFVGMVDRSTFDEWLRVRATAGGVVRRTGIFTSIEQSSDDTAIVRYTEGPSRSGAPCAVRARLVVGADGALSAVARQAIPGAESMRHVFAYHEIVRSPASHDGDRCDVYYNGTLSPDFYGWVFPHGPTTSVGTGSVTQGFSLRNGVRHLRTLSGLDQAETVRTEGAPIPMAPLGRWDNGRNVLVCGDAAGVVAPASGEGIYYAMTSGRWAAQAVAATLATGDGRRLRDARRHFMRAHGQVFRVLGMMQRYWYATDARRERFVAICRDRDVQQLTFDAYARKRLVRAKPLTHLRIFCKNIAHLVGVVPV